MTGYDQAIEACVVYVCMCVCARAYVFKRVQNKKQSWKKTADARELAR